MRKSVSAFAAIFAMACGLARGQSFNGPQVSGTCGSAKNPCYMSFYDISVSSLAIYSGPANSSNLISYPTNALNFDSGVFGVSLQGATSDFITINYIPGSIVNFSTITTALTSNATAISTTGASVNNLYIVKGSTGTCFGTNVVNGIGTNYINCIAQTGGGGGGGGGASFPIFNGVAVLISSPPAAIDYDPTWMKVSLTPDATNFITLSVLAQNTIASSSNGIVNVGASTQTLANLMQGQFNNISLSTGNKQSQINALELSTANTQGTLNAIALSSGNINLSLNTVALSTADKQSQINALEISTGAINTAISTTGAAVELAWFSGSTSAAAALTQAYVGQTAASTGTAAALNLSEQSFVSGSTSAAAALTQAYNAQTMASTGTAAAIYDINNFALSTNTWTASQIYTSSVGIQSGLGAGVTYGLSVGTLAIVNSSMSIDGIPYTWPAAQGSASTFLENNGSGGLSWGAGGSGASLSTNQYWTAPQNFSSATVSGGNGLTVSYGLITSSLAVSGSSFSLDGIPYTSPSSQGSASTVLTNNGSGVLSWGTGATGASLSANQAWTAPQNFSSATVSGGNGITVTYGANVSSLTATTSISAASVTITGGGNLYMTGGIITTSTQPITPCGQIFYVDSTTVTGSTSTVGIRSTEVVFSTWVYTNGVLSTPGDRLIVACKFLNAGTVTGADGGIIAPALNGNEWAFENITTTNKTLELSGMISLNRANTVSYDCINNENSTANGGGAGSAACSTFTSLSQPMTTSNQFTFYCEGSTTSGGTINFLWMKVSKACGGSG